MRKVHHWIDGKIMPGKSGQTGPIFNPATGQQEAEVDLASVEEVDKAVTSAKKAFASWREVPISRRTEILFKFRELVSQNKEETLAA